MGDWGTFPDIVGISLEILFLLRDTMHSAECAIMRCPSVCLLGLGIASVQTRLVSGKVEALVIRLLPSPLSSKMDSSRT